MHSQTDWAVVKSDGSIHPVRTQSIAEELVQRSIGWGCSPVWRAVSRTYDIPDWA